jgi:hypothetical protein
MSERPNISKVVSEGIVGQQNVKVTYYTNLSSDFLQNQGFLTHFPYCSFYIKLRYIYDNVDTETQHLQLFSFEKHYTQGDNHNYHKHT